MSDIFTALRTYNTPAGTGQVFELQEGAEDGKYQVISKEAPRVRKGLFAKCRCTGSSAPTVNVDQLATNIIRDLNSNEQAFKDLTQGNRVDVVNGLTKLGKAINKETEFEETVTKLTALLTPLNKKNRTRRNRKTTSNRRPPGTTKASASTATNASTSTTTTSPSTTTTSTSAASARARATAGDPQRALVDALSRRGASTTTTTVTTQAVQITEHVVQDPEVYYKRMQKAKAHGIEKLGEAGFSIVPGDKTHVMHSGRRMPATVAFPAKNARKLQGYLASAHFPTPPDGAEGVTFKVSTRPNGILVEMQERGSFEAHRYLFRDTKTIQKMVQTISQETKHGRDEILAFLKESKLFQQKGAAANS